MNPRWQAFLNSRGAAPMADGVPDFPTEDESDCTLHDLSHLGLIAVSGEDAQSFLQGQLTNDVRELTDGHSQLSSHCSPKGRMLAVFRVWLLDDTYYLQPALERVADLVKRLRMFVLRAKVEIEDASDGPVRIGIAGDCASEALDGAGLGAPTAEGGLSTRADVSVIRLPGPTARFEVLGPAQTIIGLWDALGATARPSSRGHWELLNIRAGIPTVYTATADAFVPQMANMQLVDGVSFNKGCYTGQEVVARMQYLGRLKRRMYRAEVISDTPPHPGDPLHAAASTSEQASGRVVDAQRVGAARFEMLAVVEIAATESGDVRLGNADGPRLSFQPPPYGFPPEE